MSASSEELPLGLMIPQVEAGTEIPPEPPDVGARALSVAARLLGGASTFFFLAFVFAYFYLRSLNQDHMWRPAHVKPDQALGALFIACVVLSVLASIVAGRQMKAGLAQLAGARDRGESRLACSQSCCSASSTPCRNSVPPTAPLRASSAPGAAST